MQSSSAAKENIKAVFQAASTDEINPKGSEPAGLNLAFGCLLDCCGRRALKKWRVILLLERREYCVPDTKSANQRFMAVYARDHLPV